MPEEIAQKIDRWYYAEKFGWTLEYADSLSIEDINQSLSIEDGKMHAKNSILRKE